MAKKAKPDANRRNRRAGRRPDALPDWGPTFLAALRREGTIIHACDATPVASSTVYQRKETDQEFATAFDAAIQAATDGLEREAIRRGAEGYLEPVIYQGQMMGHWVGPDGGEATPGMPGAKFIPLCVRKYSDQLLGNLLKWRRYGDRLEVSGKGGGPIETKLTLDWDEASRPRPADADPVEQKIREAAGPP